ncbi:MAG: SGNH/GDSL hydrolase family protein [Chloroflexi bacterium]|nr:SGNH/GDSL hydrolase family protein [Chloroflexota bacterium]
MHPWKHYVAIGDSFTEGIGDPVDGFQSIGCMERLAQILQKSNPDFQFTNLAKRGLMISEIRQGQLVHALKLKPDFVSIVAGANDIMKGRFEAQNFENELRGLYESTVKTGALVSSGNIPFFPFIKTLEAPVQTRLNRQIEKANSIIQNLADEYKIILVNANAHGDDFDENDWSTDFVHLNARGYFKFTDVIIQTLEKHTGVELGKAELP